MSLTHKNSNTNLQHLEGMRSLLFHNANAKLYDNFKVAS